MNDGRERRAKTVENQLRLHERKSNRYCLTVEDEAEDESDEDVDSFPSSGEDEEDEDDEAFVAVEVVLFSESEDAEVIECIRAPWWLEERCLSRRGGRECSSSRASTSNASFRRRDIVWRGPREELGVGQW